MNINILKILQDEIADGDKEDIETIKNFIFENDKRVLVSDYEIGEIWRSFSYDMGAGFLIVSERTLEEFKEWVLDS